MLRRQAVLRQRLGLGVDLGVQPLHLWRRPGPVQRLLVAVGLQLDGLRDHGGAVQGPCLRGDGLDAGVLGAAVAGPGHHAHEAALRLLDGDERLEVPVRGGEHRAEVQPRPGGLDGQGRVALLVAFALPQRPLHVLDGLAHLVLLPIRHRRARMLRDGRDDQVDLLGLLVLDEVRLRLRLRRGRRRPLGLGPRLRLLPLLVLREHALGGPARLLLPLRGRGLGLGLGLGCRSSLGCWRGLRHLLGLLLLGLRGGVFLRLRHRTTQGGRAVARCRRGAGARPGPKRA
mmetsp:Transcript_2278/g.6728  ORF Transcript_2278/g.6728 Transcript_2278/m.6728 type:complete len:286 (+) Transcript_2278:777-1634(+)